MTTLSNYYLKSYIDGNIYLKTQVNNIATLTNFYNKTQTDGISSLANYYLKSYIDSNIYNKSQVDNIGTLTNFYTKTQIDNIGVLTNFYNKTHLDKFVEVYESPSINTIIKTPPSNGGILFSKSDGLSNNAVIKDAFIQLFQTTYLAGITYSQQLHQFNSNVSFQANFQGPSAPYKKTETYSNLEVYNKTEIDDNHYSKLEVYTKTEVDNEIITNNLNYYDKTEIDTQLLDYQIKLNNGTTIPIDIGRGVVNLENNNYDNVDGAGITIRPLTNPGDGAMLSVRSSGHACRLWVGQNLTSFGQNNSYFCYSGSQSDYHVAGNYKHRLTSIDVILGAKTTVTSTLNVVGDFTAQNIYYKTEVDSINNLSN
jgi:hypothetical protein